MRAIHYMQSRMNQFINLPSHHVFAEIKDEDKQNSKELKYTRKIKNSMNEYFYHRKYF